VHARTAKITVALAGGTLRRLHVHLLSSRTELPLSAVGVVYHDAADIAPLVADLVRHHQHYSQTARGFARSWQAYHNSGRLVGEIAG
jgi:hypothetical protein